MDLHWTMGSGWLGVGMGMGGVRREGVGIGGGELGRVGMGGTLKDRSRPVLCCHGWRLVWYSQVRRAPDTSSGYSKLHTTCQRRYCGSVTLQRWRIWWTPIRICHTCIGTTHTCSRGVTPFHGVSGTMLFTFPCPQYCRPISDPSPASIMAASKTKTYPFRVPSHTAPPCIARAVISSWSPWRILL